MVGAVITHSAGTSPFRAVPKQDVDLPHGVLMNEVQLDERFNNVAFAPQLQWHCEPAKWSIRPGDRILRISPDANTDRELARRKPQGFSPGWVGGLFPGFSQSLRLARLSKWLYFATHGIPKRRSQSTPNRIPSHLVPEAA